MDGQIVAVRFFDIFPVSRSPYLPGTEGDVGFFIKEPLRGDDKSPEPRPISSGTTSR